MQNIEYGNFNVFANEIFNYSNNCENTIVRDAKKTHFK